MCGEYAAFILGVLIMRYPVRTKAFQTRLLGCAARLPSSSATLKLQQLTSTSLTVVTL